MKRRYYFALFSLLIISTNVYSIGQPFLTRQHVDKKIIVTAMPYRLSMPQGYDANKTYPLVLFLHGAGERGTNNTSQLTANRGATLWAESANQEKYPCFVVAPQCANDKQWVNTPWGNGSYIQNNVPISDQLSLAFSIVDSISREFKIDPSKIYITGLSMGGYGTWDAIMRFPTKFAAAIAFCSAGDPTKANLLETLPIRCFHSADDPIVPVKGTRDMVKAINALGPNNRQNFYTEYTNKGHASWETGLNDPTLVDWLFTVKPIAIDPLGYCNITTLGGIVSSQYPNSSTGEGKEMLFDDLENTKFLTFHNASWVQFTSKDNVLFNLKKYSITSGNDAPERDPKQFVLKGSVDGIRWTTIDSMNNVIFNSRIQTLEYNLNSVATYDIFKVEMKTVSATILQVAEVKLWGTVNNDPSSVFSVTDSQRAFFYPNPASKLLHLTFDSNEEKACTILDINGKIVKSEILYNKNPHIDIEMLENGMYFLTIQENNKTITGRFLKN